MKGLSLLANFGAVEITFTVIGVIVLALIVLLFIIVPVKAYFTALFAKAHISMLKLTAFKNCKLDPMNLVQAYILSKKSGLDLKVNQIEAVLLSGGNAIDMINAMKLAIEANIQMPFSLASALELKTKKSLEIVKSATESVTETISQAKAVTKDNIELVLDISLILKLNIPKYLFGLSVDKIKSYVVQEIIKKVYLLSKDEVFNDPNAICKFNFEEAGRDTAYILKDVRIANISIGKNLANEMEIAKVEKERIYAQIQADRMKNAEQMKELQSRTKTEQTKASLLEAEAQVPLAISQAIKEGRFSVMDYYKLMNLQADTALRRSIISGEEDKKESSSDDDDTDFGDFD